ncbi:calcium-activated chloride channel regulator 1-like [Leucoraja erinacea]|uniref:calcium-activated chloride channel regulator 1-like n=1 Tax=Leucoraja erinaceus TaxID=7782 RepID=UPI002457F901|nr:calcium-activated chloride channel regulator 1-like [Leucoraja erinacea]
MKFITVFLLSLEYLTFAGVVRCSDLKLVNNGYDNVVIAINPGLPEDENLITKIKDMVTSASFFLYNATKQRAYFRDVKILIPITWTLKGNERPTRQSYEKADVIIADSHVKFGDDPYTLQYGRCGERGRYIHFTPNFMLNDGVIDVYGSRDRVFVHEWAHLQWGVFDEYNDLVPFYFSNDEILATGCSKEIKGKQAECRGGSCDSCGIDSNTGLPNRDCMFFPDKAQTTAASIMYLQGLKDVVEFCDNKTHNAKAPNMQNKMCNYRSTWDVISKSDDFKNNPPANIPSLVPTITLLYVKDRVLCLVLDDSGSMNSGNRIPRLRQAASIFLLQIIEEGSQVGIVTFNGVATIETHLKTVDSEAVRKELIGFLPQSASGGTNICAGVRSAFQVLRGDDNATNGDEIVVLTDGEDYSINTCFNEVEQSGAIVHTIALGLSAAKELGELSIMTDGLRFLATDNVDENGLVDAFTGLVSGNGDINQQSIQLESSGKLISSNSWLNGTVFIDKTVGNDTFFVMTWVGGTPSILVRDPRGKIYNDTSFEIDNVLHTGRLAIPGTAETGSWRYSMKNVDAANQVLSITVMSRAADAGVPPVTVNAHINQGTSTWPSPLVIFAEVSHGFLPVIDAKVSATVERADGKSIIVDLLDNGAGVDAVENDGIYSTYFVKFGGNGRYSFKINVKGKDGVTRLSARRHGRALYIPGYVQNGQIQQNPSRPPSIGDNTQKLGSFQRVKSGGTCLVSKVPPTGSIPDVFPPSKIMDLKATIVHDNIQLNWTAPGDDLDQGNASHYEIRMSKNFTQLKNHFQSTHKINTTGLNPQTASSKESFLISENIQLKNWTEIYFGVITFDKANQASALSNIAPATLVPAPPVPPNSISPPNQSQPPTTAHSPRRTTSVHPGSSSQPNNSLVTDVTAIVLVVCCLVVVVTLIIAITVCIVATRGRKRVSPS